MRGLVDRIRPGLFTGGAGILLLALLTAVSRLFFQPSSLEGFDAVNYVLAMWHFDMRLGQPQPPGYFLYILMGRALALLVQDPHQALLLLSSLSSGGAVIAIFLAAREMFGGKAGWTAALLAATAPFFWFTGELAAPYAPDFFLATLFAWLAYRAMVEEHNPRLPWAAAAVLGLSGALRLQTLIFLFPLFLFALRRRPFWTVAGSSLVTGLVFGAFFLPSVMVSGGIVRFLRSFFYIVPIVSSPKAYVESAFFLRYVFNTVVLVRYTFIIVGDLVWPLVAAGIYFLWKAPRAWRGPRAAFLLMWILPSWVVFFLIWAGNIATAQVTTAVFFLLAAYGAQELLESSRFWVRRAAWALLPLILAAQVIAFTLLPERPLGESFHRLYNWDTIQKTTAIYQSKLERIRSYPADEVVIFAEEFRIPQYYLPKYRTYSLPVFASDKKDIIQSVHVIQHGQMDYASGVRFDELLPAGTRAIIFFDLPEKKVLVHDVPMQKVGEPDAEIYVIDLRSPHPIQWTSSGLALGQEQQ